MGVLLYETHSFFYHVSQNDTALEIMCESGWGYACGIHGINATLNIPTKDTKPDEWKMWPILIHDKKSLLNPEHIILDGLGKTIHLQCTASAYSNNSSLVVFQTFSMQGFPFSLIATKCLPFKCTIKYRDCCLFFYLFLTLL